MTLTVTIRDLTVGTGTPYGVRVEGTNWRTAPDFRAARTTRSGRWGTVAGLDLLGGRRLSFVVSIEEATGAEARAAERLIAGAWQPSATDLWLTVEDETGAWCYLGRPEPPQPDFEHADVGLITMDCRFEATDPRLFAAGDQTVGTGFPEGGVGRTYPLTFPRAYGASGSGGAVLLANDGTVDLPWQATITGPWVNPTITNPATGDVLELAISLGSGEVLMLDSADESVLLGSAHRLNTVQPGSVWPTIPAGGAELRFGGASGTGLASVTAKVAAWS